MTYTTRPGFIVIVAALMAGAMLALTGVTQTSAQEGEKPDLVVAAEADNASLFTGDPFSLTATVTNAGLHGAKETDLSFLISTDATITTSDTELRKVPIEPIGGRESPLNSRETSINVIPSSEVGTYYYGACVRAVEGEEETTNNCSAAVTITVKARPNLSMNLGDSIDLVIPDDFEPGDSFQLQSTVDSLGPAASPATTVRYYRSVDAGISTSDTEIGSVAVGAIEPGNSASQSITLTSETLPGEYYYGACVDAPPGDSDTTNNCTESESLSVPEAAPDLAARVDSASAASVPQGGSFTLSVTVSNSGRGHAPHATLRVYSSQTQSVLVASSDNQVGTATVQPLAPGDSGSQSVQLDAPLVIDSYYYFACVDAVIDETETSNNCQSANAVLVAVVKPNVRATGVPGISGTAQVGQELQATTDQIADDDGLGQATYSYQWLANDTEIAGATGSTYTVRPSDNGKVITVRVTFTDDAGNEESLTSEGTAAVVMGGL